MKVAMTTISERWRQSWFRAG